MTDTLVFGCVAFPIIAAVALLLIKSNPAQKILIPIVLAITMVSAIGLATTGGFRLEVTTLFGISLTSIITVLEILLLAVILGIGWWKKHTLIMIMAVIQFFGLFYLKSIESGESHAHIMLGDTLSIVMVLIVSIVGGIICFYGLGYMDEHEHHLKLTKTRQPIFFFYMLLFLGAMNGLVLSDNLTWVYFFWEVTTFCSFTLIGHDKTKIAVKNALHALNLNMIGGVAFVFAIIYLNKTVHTTSLQTLLTISPVNAGLILFPLACLCFAGFTKSAQMPFQSWLCGAMVAPTPVSALLHSSTMVKAGVYLIIRLSPIYAGTHLGTLVAFIGAFTFITASALATGQSNGKKILAYSTIANLGMIVACAGISTPAAIAAAIMLIIFHAFSKSLLFLCMGTIEQKIGSRDIEDMRGLHSIMPRTTIIMVVGIFSMMLPPFGVLLSKWMAIEAAASAHGAPLLIIMLALGSALTVLYWGRWVGTLLSTASLKSSPPVESQPFSVSLSLKIMFVSIIVLSLTSPLVYAEFVEPALSGTPYILSFAAFTSAKGAFITYPLFILIGLGFAYAWKTASKSQNEPECSPYFSGLQDTTHEKPGFTGPMNTFVEATSSNYYLAMFFGEERLTRSINMIATTLMIVMLGGLL